MSMLISNPKPFTAEVESHEGIPQFNNTVYVYRDQLPEQERFSLSAHIYNGFLVQFARELAPVSMLEYMRLYVATHDRLVSDLIKEGSDSFESHVLADNMAATQLGSFIEVHKDSTDNQEWMAYYGGLCAEETAESFRANNARIGVFQRERPRRFAKAELHFGTHRLFSHIAPAFV